MEIWQAIILGAIQGFTEFLPVSSSGHLILTQHFFGIGENVLFYSVMLHLGTLIPVIIVLFRQITDLFRKPFKRLGYLVLATIPAGVVGIILHFAFDLDAFFANNLWLLAVTFMLTAGELLFAEIISKKKEATLPIGVKTSLIMGCGQALGVLPGISRSGTTVTAGCIAKVNREENANFTFIMSIPIILAAIVLEGYSAIKSGAIHGINVVAVAVGVITAAVCGYVAIKVMLALIKRANYKWFSLYLAALSVFTLISYFAGF